MANSTNYYRNRELLSTKTFINYNTLTLTLYIYMDERHLRSPKKKKKTWRKRMGGQAQVPFTAIQVATTT
jgi:hypothetical protein